MATYNGNFEAILALVSSGATLSSTLAAGNTTGDNSLVVSNPTGNPNARIQGEDSATVDAVAAGDLVLRAGNKTAGTGDGGDLLLFAGTSLGGSAGVVNVKNDAVFDTNVDVTGNLTSNRLFYGTGSPEGVVLADSGSLYQRTDAPAPGNHLYIKRTDGVNTGWMPLGPRVYEEFIADGITATFTLTSAHSFYRDVSTATEIDVYVYWNGIRLRNGPLGDFAVTGANSIEIQDGAGNPLIPLANDQIIIDYLPL